MPDAPRVTCRTIPVEPGQLPAPATKLVITQVLQASQDPSFWALITVGAFYDSDDNIIWSTEQFAAHIGVQSESDEEQSSDEEEEEAETGRDTEAEAEADSEAEATPEPSSSPVYKLTLRQLIILYLPDVKLTIVRHTDSTPSAHTKAIITTHRPSLPIGFGPILIFAPISILTPFRTPFLTPILTLILTTITTIVLQGPVSQRPHLLSAHQSAGILSSPVLFQDTGKQLSNPTLDAGFILGSLGRLIYPSASSSSH